MGGKYWIYLDVFNTSLDNFLYFNTRNGHCSAVRCRLEEKARRAKLDKFGKLIEVIPSLFSVSYSVILCNYERCVGCCLISPLVPSFLAIESSFRVTFRHKYAREHISIIFRPHLRNNGVKNEEKEEIVTNVEQLHTNSFSLIIVCDCGPVR